MTDTYHEPDRAYRLTERVPIRIQVPVKNGRGKVVTWEWCTVGYAWTAVIA